jgi:plasmid maintenance system antidote protein VapI
MDSEAGGREQVARLLRERLDALDENQKWLAKRAGIAESTLSDILKGKQDVTFAVAKKLERVSELGVSAKTLLMIAADVDLETEERLIKDMGVIGPLYARLSPERQKDVKDFIALLYRRESEKREEDRSIKDESVSASKKPKQKGK